MTTTFNFVCHENLLTAWRDGNVMMMQLPSKYFNNRTYVS